MGKKGRYVYGIIHTDQRISFGQCGVLIAEEVYTVPYQDIAAVVSEAELDDYTRKFRNVLANLLVEHQRVNEKIMGAGYLIIPVRLGTFVKDDLELTEILERGYRLSKDIMDKAADKIEIDVAVTWKDFTTVVKEAAEEKEIKELKEALKANPTGVTVDDQMKIGALVKQAVDRKSEEYARQIARDLQTVSQRVKTHERMDEEMVANIAFLLDKGRQKAFETQVEELDRRFEDRLKFRCVGPLPPYSFYTLEINKMDFEEIDWARKKLGLAESAGKMAMKKAYQHEIFKAHPDRHPDDAAAQRGFEELLKARKIIDVYCLSVEQRGCPEEYSFKKEDVRKNNMLVRLKE